MSLRIVADDYGMAPGIDCAIRDLARRKIIQKISILANPAYAPEPLAPGDGIETGLHVDLTRPGIGLLLAGLWGNRVGTVRAIDRQLDLLESRGFTVSHADTHRHTHLLPRVLNALIRVCVTRGIPAIRCITMRTRHFPFYFRALIQHGFGRQIPKMALLYAGGYIMRRSLARAGIRFCPNLILMPLAEGGNYPALLRAFIRRFEAEEAELVTHPGLPAHALPGDAYRAGRETEYRALRSAPGP